jgi:protein ImuB
MDADPQANCAALNRLALWALQRYAPIVAADPPDGLVIDTTGATNLVLAARHFNSRPSA